MRVLVTFAVDAEFAPWRRLRNLREAQIGEVRVYQAQIGHASVDFVVTGMGMDNARRVAETVMMKEYTICIASGFAGALQPEYSIGSVLVADAVQQLGKSKTLQCNRNLVYAARDDGAKQVKLFLTSDRVVRTSEEKAQLAPFAGAVDMESFAIIAAATARRLSAVAIRVISDTSNEEIPILVEGLLDLKGRLKAAGIVRQMTKYPLGLPALVRLGRNSRTAAQSLAHFLEAFIKKLSFHSHGWPPPELQEVAAR